MLIEKAKEDFYDQLLKDTSVVKIKKRNVAIRNLENIFQATLALSNKKGFQAMSIRELSEQTRISLGALYAYFESKEQLLTVIQKRGRKITFQVLSQVLKEKQDLIKKLKRAIMAHLYLSEALQPWFYFSYMEAKHLAPREQKKAVASELESELLFTEIIKQGQLQGIFKEHDPVLAASLIKAMLQDWYLKRSKYRKRNISVEAYGQYLIALILNHFLISG